ncbi:MAG: hypothetical protein IKV44_00915 [Clostridia bacterium]|nr:hypothetical protein [Clostridia bacterium]
MKRVISLILVAATLFMLCSCTMTDSSTQLTMGIFNSVENLDPLYAAGDGERIIATNCFEGLLRFDSKGKIDLGGATAYSVSKDNLVYTFRLNPSAVWYVSKATQTILEEVGITEFDNTITAEDYIFGIKRFIERGYADLNAIKGAKEYGADNTAELGVVALDEYTLQITLAYKDPDFLYKLATLPVYPCEQSFLDALNNIYYSNPSTLLCNGPYYVEEVLDTETVLKRNPEYTGKVQIQNKSILLYITGKRNAMETRFTEGKYDIYLTPSTSRISGNTTSYTSIDATWGFAFNCSTAVGSIAELRSILLSTIDYSKIEMPSFATGKADRIIPNNYTIGDANYSDFSPAKLSYAKNAKAAQANLEVLLDRTGKEAYTVELSIPAPLKASMNAIIENWQALFEDKILFDTRVFDVEDVDKILSEGNYDLGILPLRPVYKTAFGMLDATSGAPCNYKDKKMTALKAQLKTSNEENAALCGRMEKHLVDNGVFVPLFFSSNDLYLGEGAKGVYLANGGSLVYLHGGSKPEVK